MDTAKSPTSGKVSSVRVVTSCVLLSAVSLILSVPFPVAAVSSLSLLHPDNEKHIATNRVRIVVYFLPIDNT